MRALLLVTLLALSSIFAQADLTFDSSTRFVFADLAQARQVLATRDDFVQNLSPFDRAARVNSAKAGPLP